MPTTKFSRNTRARAHTNTWCLIHTYTHIHPPNHPPTNNCTRTHSYSHAHAHTHTHHGQSSLPAGCQVYWLDGDFKAAGCDVLLMLALTTHCQIIVVTVLPSRILCYLTSLTLSLSLCMHMCVVCTHVCTCMCVLI